MRLKLEVSFWNTELYYGFRRTLVRLKQLTTDQEDVTLAFQTNSREVEAPSARRARRLRPGFQTNSREVEAAGTPPRRSRRRFQTNSREVEAISPAKRLKRARVSDELS